MLKPGATCIVGAAESAIGVVPDRSAIELMGDAALAALDDAGLTARDVDGLFAQTPYLWHPSISLGEHLGIAPRFTGSTNMGGASFVGFIEHAALAIEAGLCEVALIAYGSNQRSDGGRLVTGSEHLSFEAPYGTIYPATSYALMAQRHMAQYGTTQEQLAEVAVAARRWAQMNPKAMERGPLTIADVLSSRMISSPLHKLDCCLVTDGGGAVVLASARRAKDLRKPPVPVLGAATAHQHRQILQMPDLTVSAAVLSGERAFAMAGLGVTDIDVVQIYDSFTINVIVALEDLGFCGKGEGGEFVSGGRIAPGGSLPVNTSGGGLSYCHPGMLGIFLLIEAVRQLRAEAGERQVRGAETALVHGIGGVHSAHCTAILGTAS